VPVVGVVVGACPVKRLDKWAPQHWRNLCRLERTGIDFYKPAPVVRLGDIKPGDLFWIVGIR
jgi:hypothetical protein